MTELHGVLVNVEELTGWDKAAMYALMDEFYDDTSRSVFLSDLAEKDTCILLRDSDNSIRGFSTQKVMSVEVGPGRVHGVFSGDTVIHKDCWGSLELYRVFASHFIGRGTGYPSRYWFLISKGYKTYQMLPTCFQRFYPNYREPTPAYEQQIMDAYALARYPGEYRRDRGVIAYHGVKDKLKAGVADISRQHLRNGDTRHFITLNPGYTGGDDLVCLAELSETNLRPSVKRLLLGT